MYDGESGFLFHRYITSTAVDIVYTPIFCIGSGLLATTSNILTIIFLLIWLHASFFRDGSQMVHPRMVSLYLKAVHTTYDGFSIDFGKLLFCSVGVEIKKPSEDDRALYLPGILSYSGFSHLMVCFSTKKVRKIPGGGATGGWGQGWYVLIFNFTF